MRKIVAVIPVRAGSRRLKNKNILPFGDSNLLIHKIRQLKKVEGIEVVVSSDSHEMLHMADVEGVGIHLRSRMYADEVSVPFGEVVANVCEAIEADDIMWAPCVCPLTDTGDYEDALRVYRENVPANNDSLASFESVKMFLWDAKGPINYGLGLKHVRSQDLPDMYRMVNGMFIAPREKMIEWKYFHGRNPYKYILDKKAAVDIDDELDLVCARAYLRSEKSFKAPFPGASKVYIFSNVHRFEDDAAFLGKLRGFGFQKDAVFVFMNTIRPLVHGQEFFQDIENLVILTRQGSIGKEDVDRLLVDNHRIARSAKVWNLYGDDMAFTTRDNEFLFSVSCPEYPRCKDPTSGYFAVKMANRLWPGADVELVNFYGNDDASTHKWEGHDWDFEDAWLRSGVVRRSFIEP